MAKQVQLRRGTTAELSSVTGAAGEVIVDTTKDTLTVHDAYTAGGVPLLREDLDNLANNTIGLGKIATGTQGQVLYYNASGQLTALNPGTAGYFLSTGGSGANPSWAQVISKVANCQTYEYTSRVGTSFNNSWTNYFTGTFNKIFSNSTIIANITMAVHGEYSGGGNTRLVFGSSTQYGQYDYGISAHVHAHTRLFAITNNTQTGTLNWQYAQEQAGSTTLNPNTNDDSRLTQGSFSRVVIWEIVQ